MIYLDNAATSYPKPETVISRAVYAMRQGGNSGRGSYQQAMKAGEAIFAVREKMADMFFCESEGVIFTFNCTLALNTAIRGSVKDGEHIIISSLEHNSVLRPVEALSSEGRITYSVAKAYAADDDATVESFASLIKKETSLIVCTAVSNVFGTVLPIGRIGALCRRKGIRFIVDGAQAAGMRDINMKRDKIDILCLPGHKGLMGLMGTGALLLSQGVQVQPLVYGGTGSFSMQKQQPEVYPDRLESGTLNMPGIVSVGAGIDFINRAGGVKAVQEKEKLLTDILLSDLASIKGVILYPELQSEGGSGIGAFNIKGMHSEQVGELLAQRGFAVRAGYHCSYLAHSSCGTDKTGVVRVSPGFFSTKKDIKNLIFCLNKIAMGKKL